MNYRSDGESSPNEDDNLSENELDINDQEPNAFVTDDAFVQLSNPQDYDDMKPIEAKPPVEIDTDEQMRHQSGTPAFRSLDEVCISFCNSICFFIPFLLQLFKQGVLTGTRMAWLKSKYMDLQNALAQ